MQAEMTVDGYEVIAVKSETRQKPSVSIDPKFEKTVPVFGDHFGTDIKRLDKIVLDEVPLFRDEALHADGKKETRVFNVETLTEDDSLRTSERRENNASISTYEFLITRLAALDKRVAGRFSGTLSDEKKMRQRLQFGSDALVQMTSVVSRIRDRLNDEYRLTWKGRHEGTYTVKPFNLTAPDITGVKDDIREKYRVRRYRNAVHEEYNALNPFESKVADALDQTGLTWCRNPSRTGYGIPITEIGSDVENFYPDFLLWTEKEVWAIDPKGAHLKEGAVLNKLFDVTGVEGVAMPVRVALILEGNHTLSAQGMWVSSRINDGFSLVRRTTAGVKSQHYSSLSELLDGLLNR